MSTNTIKIVRKYLTEINSHYRAIDDLDNKVYDIAPTLLNELRSIEGWEHMIQSCHEHYYGYPDKFFDWCEVSYDEDKVIWTKCYSNGDEYTVLEIDTNKPLKKQVDDATIEYNKRCQLRDDTRTKEIDEYYRIKEKYNL